MQSPPPLVKQTSQSSVQFSAANDILDITPRKKDPWEHRQDLAKALGLKSDAPQDVRAALNKLFISVLSGEESVEEAFKPLFDTVWLGKTPADITASELDDLALANGCGISAWDRKAGAPAGSDFKVFFKSDDLKEYRKVLLERFENDDSNTPPLLLLH